MDDQRDSSPGPSSGPKPIRRLQQSLINKIAAGEIIHRPASALKELIENSLDAGATSIRITVKDGGLKFLQIQDNGCGINKEDLPILAERFTTSKISAFSDLSHLTTFGFRGEALASISYVAQLTVTTKSKKDSNAWKACYSEGALTPMQPGLTPDPKPCAGNDGTMITIADLFYNTPTRLQALRSTSEEYARILDVVTKYAIHNPHVSFTCKKGGSSSPDLSTPSSSSTENTIRLLYGQSIAKELLSIKVSSGRSKDDDGEEDETDEQEDDSRLWSSDVHFTNANYHAKKMVFLLFINHRLVESSRIKRALETMYSNILPKGTYPFVCLSLLLDPRSVDVNVHPTKREVFFLDEEAITNRICDALQTALATQSQSRSYIYQSLGGRSDSSERPAKNGKGKQKDTGAMDVDDEDSPVSSQPEPKKIYSQHKVRTSLKDRTLDSMFPVVSPLQVDESGSPANSQPSLPQSREIKESECYLSSVKTLRVALEQGKHHQLSEILEKHTFVGIVDINRGLSLIQHSTKLYLVNHGALAEELFYQLGLRQFGDFGRVKLEPPPSLRALVKLAVDVEEGTENSTMSKPQIVDSIVNILLTRRDMLSEYFNLSITADGLVETLPLLLRNYTPNLDKLPQFLMRLGPQVNWMNETECFDTFLRELGYFYVPGPIIYDRVSDSVSEEQKAQESAERWQIEHILFPTMRRYLVPPRTLLDRDVVQVANLPDLYRVFERC